VAQRERLAALAAPPTILPSPAELRKEGVDQRELRDQLRELTGRALQSIAATLLPAVMPAAI
jgi:hypothetical protein